MSERYWITGVQLGLLKVGSEAIRKSIINDIIKKQFIGNYPTEEDKKNFVKQLEIFKWFEKNKASLDKKGIPICPICSKPMQKVFDSRAGKIIGYQWKCFCNPKITMSVG